MSRDVLRRAGRAVEKVVVGLGGGNGGVIPLGLETWFTGSSEAFRSLGSSQTSGYENPNKQTSGTLGTADGGVCFSRGAAVQMLTLPWPWGCCFLHEPGAV